MTEASPAVLVKIVDFRVTVWTGGSGDKIAKSLRGGSMTKIFGMALLGAGTATVAMAAAIVSAPEIDPSTGVAAISLLAGAVLVIRGRRKK